MRIRSGDITKFIYFVGVQAADLSARDTGSIGKHVVKRSRDGGVWTTYTTPTINRTDTGGDGIFELLVDEDTTIAAGHETEEYVIHIEDTGGTMQPVTRTIELFRSDTGAIADAIWAKSSRTLTAFAFDTGVQQKLDRLDTGLSETIDRTLAKVDTGVANDVWSNGSRTLTALGANAIDTGTFTGKAASANDTGALEGLISTGVWGHSSRTLTAFAFDTGIQQALARVDTGLSETIDRIQAKVDTGIANDVWAATSRTLTANTNLEGLAVNIDQVDGDTGAADRMGKWAEIKLTDSGTFDTGTGSLGATVSGGVNVTQINGDTGAARHLQQLADEYDTGRLPAEASATLDTGAVNDAVWQTAPGTSIRTLTNLDTGNLIHLAQMSDEYDTGRLPADATATLDTGATKDAVWGTAPGTSTRELTGFAFDTGVQQKLDRLDTGLSETIDRTLAKVDTGVVLSANSIDTGTFTGKAASANDTGALEGVISAGVWGHSTRTLTGFAFDTGIQQKLDRLDTGLSETIDRIEDHDTGLRQLINRFDTGVNSTIDLTLVKLDTGFANTAVNIDQIDGDTGAANRLFKLTGTKVTDSGTFDTGTGISGGSASIDTGQVNQAVWQADASRTLTAWAFDTGVQQKLDRLDTGLSETVDRIQAKVDTGIAADVWAAGTRTLTSAHDTGVLLELSRTDTGIRQKTDSLTFDTGGNELHADIRKVNNVQIQGSGDTGLGNTWRPV